MASANKLTLFIVIFMLAGILSGAVIHSYASQEAIAAWSDNITLLHRYFLTAH
ncbi:sodium/dicarboxylate symporter [Citrobacter koseri]|uniref:Sodium/dicarboxylate symporter n=1 Tax=Citrobacter koseri TaxID=545 RepID=A0A3S4I7F8_CITKO|nr:sodium/dicarboxylate symporter [Citrobacter koseri]